MNRQVTLPVRCECGQLRGEVSNPAWFNRAVCYCGSCQAFPARLGHADKVLDARGGTDIVQFAPGALRFTDGVERLACLRLSPKGPLRWYASCCNTPIGNTARSPKLAFIGLLHSFLGGRQRLDETLGPAAMSVYVEDAHGEPKPEKRLPPGKVAPVVWNLLRGRLNGSYRQNPFFDKDGRAIAQPEKVFENDNTA